MLHSKASWPTKSFLKNAVTGKPTAQAGTHSKHYSGLCIYLTLEEDTCWHECMIECCRESVCWGRGSMRRLWMCSWRAWELPPGSAWGSVCSAPSMTMSPTPSCNYASSVPSTSTLWYFSLPHTPPPPPSPIQKESQHMYIPDPMLVKGELNECLNALHHSYLAAEYVIRQSFLVDLSLALPQAQQQPLACMYCLL